MAEPRIQYKLTGEQLENFCDLAGVNIVTVNALNDLGCLNTNFIREILIREQYDNLCHGLRNIESTYKSYSYPEIKLALSRVWRLPPKTIDEILRNRKNSHLLFCKRCGKRITPSEAKRTGGLCKFCMAEKLDL